MPPPGGEPVQVQHSADKEVDDEDLHQQRRAANELHIGDRQIAQGRIGGEAGQPCQGAEQDGKHPCHQGELDRDPDTPGDGARGPGEFGIQGIAPENGVPFGDLHSCAGDGLSLIGVEIILQEQFALLGAGGAGDHCAVKFGQVVLLRLVGDVLGDPLPAPGVIHGLNRFIDAEYGSQQHQQEDAVPEQLVGLFFHLSCWVVHCRNLFVVIVWGSA